MRGGSVGEGLVFRGRDAVALHERLREVLRALQLRGLLRRAEDLQAALAEFVDDAGGQRRLGADHGQADAFAHGQVGQLVRVADGHVADVRVECGAAIAGRGHHGLNALGLREFPCQRMFTATGAYDENLHLGIQI